MKKKFLLGRIDLRKGIGENKNLRKYIFLLFISLLTNIPLIIIDKSGNGKSLSPQLICKVIKGKYSDKTFVKEFIKIFQSYFQESYSTVSRGC